jgi:hypothetical protein
MHVRFADFDGCFVTMFQKNFESIYESCGYYWKTASGFIMIFGRFLLLNRLFLAIILEFFYSSVALTTRNVLSTAVTLIFVSFVISRSECSVLACMRRFSISTTPVGSQSTSILPVFPIMWRRSSGLSGSASGPMAMRLAMVRKGLRRR